MEIKEEFNNLLKTSFTTEQIENINEIITDIEKKVSHDKIDEVYYDACSLFYSSAKDYDNFINRLKNRPLTFHYVGAALKQKLTKEEEQQKFYDNCLKIVEVFCHQNNNLLGDCYNIEYAITNTIVPELLDWIHVDEQIVQVKDCIELKDIRDAVKEGNTISSVNFCIGENRKHHILHSSVFNEIFLQDFYYYSFHFLSMPNALEKRIKELKSIRKDIAKRIAIKTAMVFVRFGLLKETENKNNSILRSLNNKHVELSNEIALLIFDLIHMLGNDYGNGKDGMLGLFKVRKESKESDQTNDLLTKEEHSGKIKKLFEKGKVELSSIFSYDQISLLPQACLYMKDKNY